MSKGKNTWVGFGNLAADAELRVANNGTSVLKFRVACNESYKDKDGTWQDRAEFVPCVKFGKGVDSLAQYMTKGARVLVEGKLRTSNYEDRDGNKRYRTEVIVSDVILAGSKGERGGSGGGSQPADPPYDASGGYGPDDDDIPFGPLPNI